MVEAIAFSQSIGHGRTNVAILLSILLIEPSLHPPTSTSLNMPN